MVIYKFSKSGGGESSFGDLKLAMERAFNDWFYYLARPKEIIDGTRVYSEKDIFEYFYKEGWIGD